MFKLFASAIFAASVLLSHYVVADDASTETVWIDVRSWAENQIDSIDEDPHIPYQSIVEGVTESYPQKDTPIRLYCAKGGRAGKALNSLKEAGYTNIENAGGIDDVRAIRFPPANEDDHEAADQ